MKTLKTTIAILSLLLFSCSKNDDSKTATEIKKTATVTTMAGSTQGDADGNGTAAKFNGPALMTINSSGVIYVADFYNSKIKRIDNVGYTEDIVLPANSLLQPYGVTVDESGTIYVADSGSHKIKKISYGATSTIDFLAGISAGDVVGSFGVAKFNNPIGIAFSNGKLFVADSNNHKIKSFAIPVVAFSEISVFVGSSQGDVNETGTIAAINTPYGMIADNSGNLYFADTNNYKIKKITPSGLVSTVAGSTPGDSDGNAATAKFFQPQGLAIDAAGNIYVADTGNHKIKKIATDGKVTTIAGSTVGDENGIGTSAKFNSPVGIVVDASGNLFVSDFFNHKIKKITFN